MDSTERPYQVVLYCGPRPPQIDGVTVIDVTPSDPSAEAVSAALAASSIRPSDLRARALFWVDAPRDLAIATYSAICGFAGRRLDVSSGGDVLDAGSIDASAREYPDAGRPTEAPDLLQVGLVAHQEVPSVLMAGVPLEEDISRVRYAKKVRFAPVGEDPIPAIALFLVVAALRSRGNLDRFPVLCAGDEPVLSDDPTAGDDDQYGGVGLDLERVRRAGSELRRSMRGDDRNAAVDHVEIDSRCRELLAAAAVPVEETLARLGSTQDTVSELWHCPRPARHTHGDATASMRVSKGKAKCPRCDRERVDSLRLVMDVKDISPDEAADWLLAL